MCLDEVGKGTAAVDEAQAIASRTEAISRLENIMVDKTLEEDEARSCSSHRRASWLLYRRQFGAISRALGCKCWQHVGLLAARVDVRSYHGATGRGNDQELELADCRKEADMRVAEIRSRKGDGGCESTYGYACQAHCEPSTNHVRTTLG